MSWSAPVRKIFFAASQLHALSPGPGPQPHVLGLVAEELAEAGADQHRVARPHFDALGLGGALEVGGGDLVPRGQGVHALEARHIEEHAAIDVFLLRVGLDAQRRQSTGPFVLLRVDAAEHLAVMADMAQRIDGRSAMLPAEEHHVRGEGDLRNPALGLPVAVDQRGREGRIEGQQRRARVPDEVEVHDLGRLQRAQQVGLGVCAGMPAAAAAASSAEQTSPLLKR